MRVPCLPRCLPQICRAEREPVVDVDVPAGAPHPPPRIAQAAELARGVARVHRHEGVLEAPALEDAGDVVGERRLTGLAALGHEAATTKTRAALWVDLPDALAEAIETTLPPREDRDSEARLFGNVGADRLRTAIARACRAAGVPVFSPHDLRHRRISLLHRQGRSWAEIGRFVGQRKLSGTADIYTHVLSDGRELDYEGMLRSA